MITGTEGEQMRMTLQFSLVSIKNGLDNEVSPHKSTVNCQSS